MATKKKAKAAEQSVAKKKSAPAEASASKKKVSAKAEASVSKKKSGGGSEASVSAKKPAAKAEASTSKKKTVASAEASTSKKKTVTSAEASNAKRPLTSAEASTSKQKSIASAEGSFSNDPVASAGAAKKNTLVNAEAAQASSRRDAVTQESAAVSRSARPSAPRKEEISTKRSAHTPESSSAPPSAPRKPAPRPAPFVPFVMPPPRPLPLKEFADATHGPSWETRATEPDQMPRPSSLEARLQLNWPALLADGSAIGLERGKLTEAHVVRVSTDGERARLSKPGQFSFITLSADRESIYGVSGDGKIWSFPAQADATRAVTVFQGTGAVWSVTPLDATRAVIAQAGAIRLLDTSTSIWKEIDAVSVQPISIPLVDAVDEGRWIVVGRSPKIHLFAVRNDSLVAVQSWLQVEGGVSVVEGRAFLYTAGNLVREELLNLRAVHGSLE